MVNYHWNQSQHKKGIDMWRRSSSLKGPSFAATDEPWGQFLWFAHPATLKNTNTKYKIQNRKKWIINTKCGSVLRLLWKTLIRVDFSRTTTLPGAQKRELRRSCIYFWAKRTFLLWFLQRRVPGDFCRFVALAHSPVQTFLAAKPFNINIWMLATLQTYLFMWELTGLCPRIS